MMTDAPIFSRPLDVAALAAKGSEHRISATLDECATLAKALKLPRIDSLDATLAVEPERGGIIHIHGELSAEFQQICSVAIEPFVANMREPVDIRFAPPEKVASMAKAAADDPDADDPPDPYEDNRIDLGAIVQEFFVLSLDPYPRKPGAIFEYSDGNDEKPSPFTKLAALTSRSEN